MQYPGARLLIGGWGVVHRFGAEAIALVTVKRTEFGLADACCVLKDCRKYLLEVAG